MKRPEVIEIECPYCSTLYDLNSNSKCPECSQVLEDAYKSLFNEDEKNDIDDIFIHNI